MHRARTGIAMALALAATIAGPATLARGAEPTAADGRPLVGAWLVDTAAEDPANPPSKVVFSGDGTYLQVDVDGSVGVGSWEATGPQGGAVTILFHGLGPDGAPQAAVIRASVEMAEDGQSLSAPYTVEFVGPDGTPSGQLGPGTATGTRIAVEPMGTPVGPLPVAAPAPESAEASPSPGA